MIDIVFYNSTAMSLMEAMHLNGNAENEQILGHFFKEENALGVFYKQQRAEKLNHQADVYAFDLLWDIGRISERGIDSQCKKILQKENNFYLGSLYGNDVEQYIKLKKEELRTVLKRIAAKEEVRIYYSFQPDEMCGLYWFLSLISDRHGKVTLMNMSNNISSFHSSWREVKPEEWVLYEDLQQQASDAYIDRCAMEWNRLKKENGDLRAVVNGQLISVSESFYDELILKELNLQKRRFKEDIFIHRFNKKYRLGIHESLIHERLNSFIEKGILEVVEEAKEDEPLFYRWLLKGIDNKLRMY